MIHNAWVQLASAKIRIDHQSKERLDSAKGLSICVWAVRDTVALVLQKALDDASVVRSFSKFATIYLQLNVS